MRRALLTATILALVMVGPARAECMRAEEADNIAEGRLMARGDAMILEEGGDTADGLFPRLAADSTLDDAADDRAGLAAAAAVAPLPTP